MGTIKITFTKNLNECIERGDKILQKCVYLISICWNWQRYSKFRKMLILLYCIVLYSLAISHKKVGSSWGRRKNYMVDKGLSNLELNWTNLTTSALVVAESLKISSSNIWWLILTSICPNKPLWKDKTT